MYFIEYDETDELYYVFTPDGSKAVSSWCDEENAKEDCEKRNAKV
jgi:hypothetical protein